MINFRKMTSKNIQFTYSQNMINLFLIDYYNQNNSGLTTYVKQLSTYLNNTDGILLNHIWARCNKYKEFKKESQGNGSFHYYIPDEISRTLDPSFDIKVATFLANEIKGLKNVIFHFNWINHVALGQQLKQKIDCTILLTKHCIPWRDYITQNYSLFQTINKGLQTNLRYQNLHPALVREQLVYSTADHIICVTELAKKNLEKIFQIPAHKISLIRNGLPYRKSKPFNKVSLRRKYGIPTEEKIILYAGAVNERKGCFDLVKSFSKIISIQNDVRLVIAGGGDHAGFLRNIKSNWTKITLTGNLDKKTLFDFYQMADIGIVPSYIEQCSYTAIEMMHSELPIIIAGVDGLKEMVPKDCGLHVKLVLSKAKAYIDHADLRKKILFYLDNEAVAKKHAANAKAHAKLNFDVSEMISSTMQAYRNIGIKNKKPNNSLQTLKPEPLVSVLLTCNDGINYLENCIQSILSQTYTNFELLIINTSPTDQTRKIVRKFQDNRIIELNNNERIERIKFLNQSIMLAAGKYIARINADHTMHRQRLKVQVDFLENPKNQKVALIGSYNHLINDSGRLYSVKHYPIKDEEIKVAALFQNPFSDSSVMIRTNILQKYKYKIKNGVEDYALWIRLFQKYHVANIPEYLTSRQMHKPVNSLHNNKESLAELISSYIDKAGIPHSAEELAIHIAVALQYGPKYFNSAEKLIKLKSWLDKVLQTLQMKHSYSNSFVRKMHSYILETCCGIYNRQSM